MRAIRPSQTGAIAVRERLVTLCVHSASELLFAGTSIRLMTHREYSAMVAASTVWSAALDEAQYGVGEGPARDAFKLGRPVLADDLASDPRWPAFSRTALTSQCHALFAFPLTDAVGNYGTMTHYSNTARGLSETEVDECSIYASVATDLLLDTAPPATKTGSLVHDIGEALDLRVEVFQAQGIVMVDLDVTLDEAMACLRARAYAEDRSLNDLAVDVVSGAVRFTQSEGDPTAEDTDPGRGR